MRTFALAASLLLPLAFAAKADTGQAPFCIVPVKDGAPSAADVGATWRIHNLAFRIPGLPALVFTPVNRGGQWTISADRRLVPYAGPFPKTYFDLDNWVAEPWSSRIVAVTSGGGVSVLRPGTGRFEAIDTADAGPDGRYINVVALPRRKQTIVVSGSGTPFIVEDASLRPWLSPEELAAHGLRGLYSLHDAPSLSATIVVDLDRRIHVLADDGSWHEVASIGAKDYGHVVDAAASGVALFIANRSVIAIWRDSEGSSVRFSANKLATTSANGRFRFPVSRLFQRVLAYGGAGIFDPRARWRHLGSAGMEDIPGGDIGLADSALGPQIQDLPTLSRTLIRGRDGLFLYDGATIVPVPRSGRSDIGRFPRVYDLSSVGRVIVASEMGLFELTRDGGLVAKTMPFAADGLPILELADWPEAGVALVSTRNGIYALDRGMKAVPVPGGDRIKLGYLDFAVGTNPGTGEMVLSDPASLFLAVRAEDGKACTP